MKKITLLLTIGLAVLAYFPIAAQVDPSQEIIVIEGGNENVGSLETTINEDVDGEGNRLNPNRIYQLKKDQVYIQQSPINFNDIDGKLTIVGEEGGKMPIVLMQPLEGVEDFANEVAGDLKIENVFWPAMNLNGEGTTLFAMNAPSATLELDRFVTENARADVFNFRNVTDYADVYIKNSYFRDLSQLSNSWNYVVFARGNNGEPFDTLWIENTTISNGGMPLFGKGTVTEFMYMNHVTFVNSTKYPIWMERYGEAYIVNTLFINANWEGECQATWETQIGEDFIPSGQIRFDTIEADFWASTPGGAASAPAMEDLKILASNNLNYFSPLLDPYYNGEYNDFGDKPMSNRPWGSVGDDGIPTLVSNLPVPLFSDRELALIADWEGIKADNNYDQDTDPELVTKGVRDAAAAEEFAHFARNNYQVADEGETWDRTQIWFGDGDATTVPGPSGEDSDGISRITDLPEDFSYENSSLYSLIDGRPLGSLSWWPGHLAEWDSEAAFADVMQYYADGVAEDQKFPTGINDLKVNAESGLSIYPNPSAGILNIVSENAQQSAKMFDLTGKLMMEIDLQGSVRKELDISDLNKGIYILQVESVKGETKSRKFVKK